ncbi:MAG: hypothetical protein AB1472_04740 [Candidatus Omnitrophota bacterium]
MRKLALLMGLLVLAVLAGGCAAPTPRIYNLDFFTPTEKVFVEVKVYKDFKINTNNTLSTVDKENYDCMKVGEFKDAVTSGDDSEYQEDYLYGRLFYDTMVESLKNNGFIVVERPDEKDLKLVVRLNFPNFFPSNLNLFPYYEVRIEIYQGGNILTSFCASIPVGFIVTAKKRIKNGTGGVNQAIEMLKALKK